MTAVHGKAGSVKLGAATVLDIDSWSVDFNRDVKEDTAFLDGGIPSRSYVGGLSSATGKISGNLNMTDSTGQFALWTSLTSDTPLAASFGTTTPHAFAGNIFITKFSPKAPVGDLETVEFDFQFTGAVTFS
jgi:hypothetical protein